MASRSMLLPLFILFIFVHARGQEQPCPKATSFTFSQTRTGKTVGGQPEWEAVIRNNCNCVQSNVMLYCPDFYSTEPIDPYIILKLDDDRCSLRNGGPIRPGEAVTFRYANDATSPFQLLFHDVTCGGGACSLPPC